MIINDEKKALVGFFSSSGSGQLAQSFWDRYSVFNTKMDKNNFKKVVTELVHMNKNGVIDDSELSNLLAIYLSQVVDNEISEKINEQVGGRIIRKIFSAGS